MLIQNKSLNTGDVVVIKVPGEEYIGRVAIGTDASTLRLTKALRILLQMVNTPNGPAAQMTFAPFAAGADEEAVVEIDRTKLAVAPLKPSKEVSDAYLQQTSSLVAANAPFLNA
jgi:hypothetical protein